MYWSTFRGEKTGNLATGGFIGLSDTELSQHYYNYTKDASNNSYKKEENNSEVEEKDKN